MQTGGGFAVSAMGGISMAVLVVALAASGPPATASARKAPPGPEGRTSGYNPERNAYFGDLHVHTKLSFDAYIFNVRSSPDDAYRFAKGETIGHASGFDIRLAGGPLDFVAVTDHAEFIGAMEQANTPGTAISKVPGVSRLFSPDPREIGDAFARFIASMRDDSVPREFRDPSIHARAWKEVREAAARHNEPGRFTTFVGYEFTSAPDGRNLHRNVIFRSGDVPDLPYSSRESADPEELWKRMEAWRGRGVEALAIPHNSNGSDGTMFGTARFNGAPMDRVYADLRRRNEPLVEVTQIKGTSETHPSLSPNDEWAGFEIFESYIGTNKAVTKFAGGYVRDALKDGLLLQESRGFNPYRFGFIGSSDTHNSAPGSVEETNYFSKVGRTDGLARLRGSVPPGGAAAWDPARKEPPRYQNWGASGLAGVWAEENTRDSIYDALRRRETFATSGPRIRVRFFASYDYPADLLKRPDLVRQAYARGVPMGGDLMVSRGKAPTFLVWGSRDPNGGYLQRAQVVKGWIENGVAKEKVYDVACSDGLTVDPKTSRCPDNGAKVDLATCAPSRFKGDVELRTLWTDPDFNARQRAFYYVRVLENPSCRWSTWDALRNGTPPNPDLSPTVMERAWSSPIWYDPKA